MWRHGQAGPRWCEGEWGAPCRDRAGAAQPSQTRVVTKEATMRSGCSAGTRPHVTAPAGGHRPRLPLANPSPAAPGNRAAPGLQPNPGRETAAGAQPAGSTPRHRRDAHTPGRTHTGMQTRTGLQSGTTGVELRAGTGLHASTTAKGAPGTSRCWHEPPSPDRRCNAPRALLR